MAAILNRGGVVAWEHAQSPDEGAGNAAAFALYMQYRRRLWIGTMTRSTRGSPALPSLRTTRSFMPS